MGRMGVAKSITRGRGPESEALAPAEGRAERGLDLSLGHFGTQERNEPVSPSVAGVVSGQELDRAERVELAAGRLPLPRLGGCAQFAELVDEIGGPVFVAEQFEIPVRQVRAWMAGRGEAPRVVFLALFWRTHWGLAAAFRASHETHMANVAKRRVAEDALARCLGLFEELAAVGYVGADDVMCWLEDRQLWDQLAPVRMAPRPPASVRSASQVAQWRGRKRSDPAGALRAARGNEWSRGQGRAIPP